MGIIIPTSLTEKQTADFQRLYVRHFGKEISKELAEEKGLALMRFIIAIVRDMPEFQNYQGFDE